MRARLSNPFIRVETIIGAVFSDKQWNDEFTITPKMAKAIIAQEPNQRPVRPAKIIFWRDTVRDREFVTTPQGFMVDTEGRLLNGQHRLLGCIEADIPIRVMVFFNRPRNEFKVYDRGIARTVGDDLVTLGAIETSDANVMQAAARLLFHHDAGRLPWVPNPHVSVDKVIKVMDRHPLLQSTVSDVFHNRGPGRSLPSAPTAAFFTLFREVDDAQAGIFLEQLRTGSHIGTNFPAMAMRVSMERDRTRKYKDSRNAFMVRIVHAWNAFYEERTLSVLVSVPVNGKFPKISGYKLPK